MQMSDKARVIVAIAAIIALKSWGIWNQNLAIVKVTQIRDCHFPVSAKITIFALHVA